ncbi:hypothetical protein N4R57_15000 [Rhodobacteraceae bacterium D3-12]|nr:hypothetical protein N4R57_15000 [Rhodobacteraceae bacterium D3-12]
MFGSKSQFDKRLTKIDRSGRRASKGYGPVVGPDGMIVVRRRKSGINFPIRGLVYLLAGFVLFKAIALAQFGEQGYNDRLLQLISGTAVEQAGAWIMQVDPASQWLADKIRPILR